MLVVSVLSKYYVIWHSAHNFPAANLTFFIYGIGPQLYGPPSIRMAIGWGKVEGAVPVPDPIPDSLSPP